MNQLSESYLVMSLTVVINHDLDLKSPLRDLRPALEVFWAVLLSSLPPCLDIYGCEQLGDKGVLKVAWAAAWSVLELALSLFSWAMRLRSSSFFLRTKDRITPTLSLLCFSKLNPNFLAERSYMR